MGILVFSYLVEHHSLEELAAAVFLNLSFMILLLYLLHFSAWLDQEPRGHRAGSRYVGMCAVQTNLVMLVNCTKFQEFAATPITS